ncbi:type II toxin-antitoxin system ParD family antitoxin [Paraglaciecola arctica]|nr:type II toxin-antitoxin system ParD family antitoxin [Paraglaciecola arctica]
MEITLIFWKESSTARNTSVTIGKHFNGFIESKMNDGCYGSTN